SQTALTISGPSGQGAALNHGFRQSHHSRPISTTLVNANPVKTPMVTLAPFASSRSAPADGASACTIRLGNASLPIRRGNRTGPNRVSGKVPRPQYEIEALGIADDLSDADGVAILNFWQAQNIARDRMVKRAHAAVGKTGPLTVSDAMDS